MPRKRPAILSKDVFQQLARAVASSATKKGLGLAEPLVVLNVLISHRLVAVVVWLVRSGYGNTDVVRLFGSQRLQLDAQLFEVQASHLLVQFLW